MTDKQNRTKKTVPCPECDTPMQIKDVSEGKIIECPACGTESEIVSVSPLKLAPLEEEK